MCVCEREGEGLEGENKREITCNIARKKTKNK